MAMEVHTNHTMYHSKVYVHAHELLQLNRHRGAENLRRTVGYWKNIPWPPLGTAAHWCAHPDNLLRYAEIARRREAEEKRKQEEQERG